MNLTPEAQAQLAELAINLAKDEKIGKDVKRRISELDPTKRFADVESEDLRNTVAQEFARRDQEDAARKTQERLESQKNSLISSGRFRAEEVKEVEAVMEKYGIADYEAGAKLYAADVKPAAPTSVIQGRTWEMPKLSKENMENPNYYRDKMYSVIGELQQARK